jgi:hypothetical protein
MKFVFFALCFSLASPSFAQVFKCKGPNGKVVYSDAACGMPDEMERVKTNQNTMDASGDRRNVEMLRAKTEIEALEYQERGELAVLESNPPPECKFKSYKNARSKRLAEDATQECLKNVIAKRKRLPTSDAKYRQWNDDQTLRAQQQAANAARAAAGAAASAASAAQNAANQNSFGRKELTCRPNMMGTELQCR